MAATYVIFFGSDDVPKIGVTTSETPTALESASDLLTVEANKVARSLRRLLQRGQAAGLHEFKVSS
jgi:hypothetical protein